MPDGYGNHGIPPAPPPADDTWRYVMADHLRREHRLAIHEIADRVGLSFKIIKEYIHREEG